MAAQFKTQMKVDLILTNYTELLLSAASQSMSGLIRQLLTLFTAEQKMVDYEHDFSEANTSDDQDNSEFDIDIDIDMIKSYNVGAISRDPKS